MHPPRVQALYDAILGHGPEGVERFRAAMRARGVPPFPDPERNYRNLYAPNPVIVSGSIVDTMTADANAFCDVLRELVATPEDLLRRVPGTVRDEFASPEAAGQILADARRAHPLICLDAFLVETADGLEPAYLEWQTVGTYATLGRWVVECAAAAWPEIREYSTLTATRGMALDQLSERLRALYLEGIADDPRQGIVVDYLPHTQPTRMEFYAIQELTGGPERGMGIVDPREIVLMGGRPHYRRDGVSIPIRRVYSRLVYSDLLALLDETRQDETIGVRRMCQSGDLVTWISHPLHFFYGSKADFPELYARGLSTALPECVQITDEFVREQAGRLGLDGRLEGYVQKPTDAQGGKAVQRDPLVADLHPRWILQRVIPAAACHPTLAGPRTPEVRVMGIPDESGKLITALIFTRVKAPDVFISNAGYTAKLGIPGTGEGYGIVVFDPAT